ncbi:MAG: hypothetical protein GY757_35940 [bacterium]|nr:hypothetical protein [bacterium]
MDSEAINKIKTTRRLFNTGLFLILCSRFLAIWITAAAISILILKVTGIDYGFITQLILLTSLPVILLALAKTSQEKYSHEETAAWLDLHGKNGGSIINLLTLKQGVAPVKPGVAVPVKPDMEKPGTLNLINAKITALPMIKNLIFPALFLIACLLVPARHSTSTISPQAIHKRADSVKKHIEKSRRLSVLEQKEFLALQEEMLRAVNQAESSPTSAVEAVDHVQNKLDMKILKKARAHKQAFSQWEKLLEQTSNPGSQNLDDLAASLKQALDSSQNKNLLPPDLQKALDKLAKELKNCGLDGSALDSKALENAFKNMEMKDLKKIASLLKQAHKNSLNNCNTCSSAMSNKLAKKIVNALANSASVSSAMKDFENKLARVKMVPGKGGTSRGRGDAPLVLGNESETSAARFKPMFLKPGSLPIPGSLIGKKKIAPLLITPVEFRPPQRLNATIKNKVSGSTTGEHLGPYQKKIAARYFEQVAKGDKK